MSKSELHDWESSINQLGEKNIKALLEIAQDIYNTAYARGKSQNERPKGEWIIADKVRDYYYECPFCRWKNTDRNSLENFCPNCGAEMRRQT